MRISDWSSDVCSSDLLAPGMNHGPLLAGDVLQAGPGPEVPELHPVAGGSVEIDQCVARHLSGPEDEQVGPCAADQPIRPQAAVQDVVLGPGVAPVAAGDPHQLVVPAPPPHTRG